MEGTGVIPVFYNADIEISQNILKACYDGGIRVFEYTNRGAGAAKVFPELVKYVKSELPGMCLGVGSISFGCDAWKFIKMGAEFIVGPQYVPSVNRICRLTRTPYIPGCATVSEVGRAQRAGSDICKVFPGDILGPKFVKGLLAPMPWSRLMVTGGVKPEEENLAGWFSAGVKCVGMGSNLFPKEVIAAGDWAQISQKCRNVIDIIERFKK